MEGCGPTEPAVPSLEPNDDDLTDELERLGRLHERGLLTDDELEATKRRLREPRPEP